VLNELPGQETHAPSDALTLWARLLRSATLTGVEGAARQRLELYRSVAEGIATDAGVA
jgi:hypothetical protein